MRDPDELVSDAERDQAVVALREHLLVARLTLEEFSERVEVACQARIGHELALASDGLPAPASVQVLTGRRKPTRFTTAFFSHVVKRGRLRLRRRTVAVSVFSDLDLDLRDAELDSPNIVVTVLTAIGNVDVYVPDGITVEVGGLSLFGHRRERGRETDLADGPLIRLRVLSIFGTVDVWLCRLS